MSSLPARKAAAGFALALAAVTTSTTMGAAPAVAAPAGGEEFYVPRPDHGAQRQIATLTSQGRKADAAAIKQLISIPSAVWFTGDTAKQTEQSVKATVKRAEAKGQVPVLVAYNLPFRDCSQYSAGGATNVAEYERWIDAFARGIGDSEAVVIVEPDGLGIIPWYTTINGAMEWCQPAAADPGTAAAERFRMLNHAVDALGAQPAASVYLDGTHNGWLGVGDAADRLIKAGVTRADGFFLNVSNYQWSDRLEKYGNWVSQCIHLDQNTWFQRSWCGSQYFPASPTDFSTWGQTDATYDKAYADTGLTRDPDAMAHFVIDSSRNGQGPWTPPAGTYPDPQDWCNPPERGLGIRPTSDTDNPLLDAYLWIKLPGESDGECSRGLTDNGGVDPIWGQVDPAAGDWFDDQALELAELAVPPLTP